ncbi:hypothetical protein VNI00_002156 [Paramarasmius palmivorus]|uniref:Uncharacterized protein n=1 Tax=Paramarasmius palmivorus TaxID=297713 RepID=A0AAW0E0M5_9AGAR
MSLQLQGRDLVWQADGQYMYPQQAIMKKKSKTIAQEQEDLFSESVQDEGDLFSAEPKRPSTEKQPKAATKPIELAPSKKLSAADRHARFTSLLDSLLPHITPLPSPPKNPTPAEEAEYAEHRKAKKQLKPIRHSVWTHLVGLAQSKAELGQVVELMPKWKESKKVFDGEFGQLFVARCEHLSAQDLALTVFGNYAKYGVPLTLPAARHLLHSLHATRPLEEVLVAAKLYEVHDLGSYEQDLTSSALVLSAAARAAWGMLPPQPKAAGESQAESTTEEGAASTNTASNRPAVVRLVNTLLPSLRELLKDTTPGAYRTPRTGQEKSKIVKIVQRNKRGKKISEEKVFNREKVWLRWCLSKAQALLDRNDYGQSVDWLREWRTREGHAKAVAAGSA